MVENLKLPFCSLTKYLEFSSVYIFFRDQLIFSAFILRKPHKRFQCFPRLREFPSKSSVKQEIKTKLQKEMKCQGRPESDFRVESSWSAIFPGKVLDKKS